MEGYTIDLVLDRARQLVHEATALYRKDRAVALSEFSNPKGRFVIGEQYVFVLDTSGVMLAHGANKDYVGQDFYSITDIDGKMFTKEIVDRANAHGSGWVEYKWLDPVTKTKQPKTVYFEKTDGAIICSGVYGADPASSIHENPFHEHVIPAPTADFSALHTHMGIDAQEHETDLVLDDAKGLVEKAISFFKANHKGAALAEFSNPKGSFTKGEQYVFVLDSNGVMLAHGVNEKYVGKDFYRTMDSEGKRFMKEIVDAANSKGNGWVEYKWLDPVTKTEQPKTVYFEKTNGVIICSGIYK
jgi:signal transduction histidine kinase